MKIYRTATARGDGRCSALIPSASNALQWPERLYAHASKPSSRAPKSPRKWAVAGFRDNG